MQDSDKNKNGFRTRMECDLIREPIETTIHDTRKWINKVDGRLWALLTVAFVQLLGFVGAMLLIWAKVNQ